MTEKEDNTENEAEVGLGHDPLEWLQDDEEPQETDIEQSEPSEPTAETKVEPEPESATEYTSFRIEGDTCYLTIPEKLTIHIVEALHSEWCALLNELPKTLQVDAGDTVDADAAGVQLLFAVLKQMAFKGVDVQVVAIHPTMQQLLATAGLSDFFAQYQQSA